MGITLNSLAQGLTSGRSDCRTPLSKCASGVADWLDRLGQKLDEAYDPQMTKGLDANNGLCPGQLGSDLFTVQSFKNI